MMHRYFIFTCISLVTCKPALLESSSPSSQASTSSNESYDASKGNPDIVVLKWPPPKVYYPAHDLPNANIATHDQIQKRQHIVNLIVPQGPDPINPNEAPLPPHPYYQKSSVTPDHDQDEEKTPEAEWKKIRDKIRLKPVNHQMLKTNGKHVPTLPYAPTQPLYELQYGIDQIRRAIHKMHPIAGLANDVFKKFNIAVKARIKNMRGPYGYSYPPGYYDHIYEADDNPNPSEPRPVFVPQNVTTENDAVNTTTSITLIDKRSDRRYDPPATIPPPDPDRDDLEQRSFGFKVTVFKTPKGKENITEELFDGDKHLVFHSPSAIPPSTADDVKASIDPLYTAATSSGYSPHYLSSFLQPPGRAHIRSFDTNGTPFKAGRNVYDHERESNRNVHQQHEDLSHKQHEITAHEFKQKQRLKHEASHDKRKSVEKALKETTVIEFFEREKLLDDSNGDPAAAGSVDQIAEGSERKLYYEPKPQDSRSHPHHLRHMPSNSSSYETREGSSKAEEAVLTEYGYNPTGINSHQDPRPHPRSHVHGKRHELHPRGWKEHGYRITQEVEYVDRDAAQVKGFEARDRGKAEHVKDLKDRKKQTLSHDQNSEESLDSAAMTAASPDQEDNPLIPSSANDDPNNLPSLASTFDSHKRKFSRLPPHASSYSKADDLNNNGSGYLHFLDHKAADSRIHMRREDAPKLNGFVEILANLTYTSTSTVAPLASAMPTTATTITTTEASKSLIWKPYSVLRMPPNDNINALTIIESPLRLNASASSNIPLDSSKKYSKIISIDDPHAEKQMQGSRKHHSDFMRLLTQSTRIKETSNFNSFSTPLAASSFATFHASLRSPSTSSSSPPTHSESQIPFQSYPHTGINTSLKHQHNFHANQQQQQQQQQPIQNQLQNHYRQQQQSYHNSLKNNDHHHSGYDKSNEIAMHKLLKSLQTTAQLSKLHNNNNNNNNPNFNHQSYPFMSLPSGFTGSFTRPSVFQSITSSGKSMISRLKKPLQKLPSMKRLRFLPSSLTSSDDDEKKDEEEVMKTLTGMDNQKIIESLLSTASGERRTAQLESSSLREDDADQVSRFLDDYMNRGSKEIDDRSDSYADDTSLSPSLLTIQPVVDATIPINKLYPMYSQPLVLKHDSPARKVVDAIKKSLWIADRWRRYT